MVIRKAIPKDTLHVVRSLQNKGIEYATTAQAKQDISSGRMFLLENNGKIVAMCSIVYDERFNYYAIKRMVVFNKKNYCKGYATRMFEYLSNIGISPIGCTPWIDNIPMRKMLVRLGFTFQYTFNNNWTFYKKTLDK